jgi:multiple sugar transport system ATP-binding protein
MRVELKKLHERLGTTAIYVTHDQVEAMTLGDRVVVMKDGWVQQVGEPLELYNTPANRFVAGFIGSPAMNFIEATLGESNGAVVAEAPGLRLTLPGPLAARARAKAGRAVTVGIRPEDVHVATDSDPADLCFDAIVEVVEQLGSEILLDTRVGPATVVASVEPTMRIRSNDRLRMSLKPERLHLFDAETEAAI